MKLFLQVNKVLLVVATLCFIFIFLLGSDLSAHGRSHRTVLYNHNDCNKQLLIKEERGAIVIRAGEAGIAPTLAAEFHPGSVAKLTFE